MFTKNRIFLLIFLQIFTSVKSHEKTLTKIIENHQKITTVNFINLNAENSLKFNNFVDEISKNSNLQTTVRILNSQNFIEIPQDGVCNLNIIFPTEIEELIDFLASKVFKSEEYFVIVTENSNLEEKEEIFQIFWKFFYHNVIILESGRVFTFFPFSRNFCDLIKTVELRIEGAEVGNFKNPVEGAQKFNFFPPKFLNFNNCSLKVTTFESEATFKLGPHIYGRDFEIIKALAFALNFHLDLDFVNITDPWDVIYSNGTITGAFKKLVNHESSFALGNYFYKPDRVQNLDFSTAYAFDPVIFVTPKQRQLNSLRKLVRPFMPATWTALILTLIGGGFVIIFVRKKSQKVRNFVFGFRLATPFMNFLMEIFGISQPRLPGRNFSRFLLMNFLIFTLVMRSAYQGSLFRFLQTKDYAKDPQNLAEIIEMGYKVITVAVFEDFLGMGSEKRGKIVITKEEEYLKALHRTIDVDFHAAVLTSGLQFKESNRKCVEKYGKKLRVAKVGDFRLFLLNNLKI